MVRGLKTRYNKSMQNALKHLTKAISNGKTRYNIQSWFHSRIDRESISFMLNRYYIWTVAWSTWENMLLIIIPSFVPAELLQWGMIVLGFYLLYRVFTIENLVAQDLQFKTRYNFFLGITFIIPNSVQ